MQKQSAQKKVEGNEKTESAAKKDDYRWKNLVRTALGIEARDGKLHLFLPPLPYLESYVNLLALIERTAMELDLPVIIEGYEPPKDHRMQKLLVTPDPGVIEVNIHPSDNWSDMVSNMTELYQAAKESRLSTEKFMLDGRHTGTGGGNHITLGGATPSDSPFLRLGRGFDISG